MTGSTTIDLSTLIAVLGTVLIPLMGLQWRMNSRLIDRADHLVETLRQEQNARMLQLEQSQREAPHMYASREDFIREYSLLRRELRTLNITLAEIRGAQSASAQWGQKEDVASGATEDANG